MYFFIQYLRLSSLHDQAALIQWGIDHVACQVFTIWLVMWPDARIFGKVGQERLGLDPAAEVLITKEVRGSKAAVALTQISAHIMHTNPAVRKIMEGCGTREGSGTRSQHVSNKTWRKRSRNRRELQKELKRLSFTKNILFRWIVWWT